MYIPSKMQLLMNSALADTGYWKALLKVQDPYSSASEKVRRDFIRQGVKFLCPWPCVYETLNTEVLGKWEVPTSFQKRLKTILLHVEFVDDEPYRDESMATFSEFRSTLPPHLHKASLVDRIVWAMIADPTLRITHFVHGNPSDFNAVKGYFPRIQTIDLTQ